MLKRLLRRTIYFLRRDQHARDLAEEMDFHRSLLARRSPGEGGSGGAAFGNATLAGEDARSVWIWRWAEDAWQDVQYALRSMRWQTEFTVAAIAIIALGTGATTCVFGLFDALVVKSLPAERPQRLVWFGNPAFSYTVFRLVQSRMPVCRGQVCISVQGWGQV